LGALRADQTEVLLGLGTVLLAAGLFAALPHSGFATMLLIGDVFQGLNYSTAAALALLAERDVRLGRGAASVGQPNLTAELVEGGDVS